ncbi:hypothetical protein [Bacillus chungangensis]|uniref:Lipopolysaccharide/colanic/teichoic acid biosynthesis glycosyltransferase n=1 Tax=Bacillus chungangensis TaxID=587633 RepID=A0ABT9WXL7_9BACI|nr:hypothetical protein [Bacillus chungangensis]MDQ0178042.1 lipopolysaccharide/colanic/teichoic acid biosynthesis glycosyltransferase [Bacillus chungangensis]
MKKLKWNNKRYHRQKSFTKVGITTLWQVDLTDRLNTILSLFSSHY